MELEHVVIATGGPVFTVPVPPFDTCSSAEECAEYLVAQHVEANFPAAFLADPAVTVVSWTAEEEVEGWRVSGAVLLEQAFTLRPHDAADPPTRDDIAGVARAVLAQTLKLMAVEAFAQLEPEDVLVWSLELDGEALDLEGVVFESATVEVRDMVDITDMTSLPQTTEMDGW